MADMLFVSLSNATRQSPLVSTMNFLSISKAASDSPIDYSIPCKVKEDTTAILPSNAPADVRAGDAWKRRTYFAQEGNRKGITFGKDVHFKVRPSSRPRKLHKHFEASRACNLLMSVSAG